MKISYKWLKEYVRFEEGPDELGKLLTDSGLEVEGIEKFESISGNLQGVFTGLVLSCEKHPEADRLTLTKVDTGGDAILSIVCGAPNVRPGQKVLVATVGTTLNTASGELVIKKAKIRGQASEGMICAEDELGVGTSHDGIMVLPDDTPIGVRASDFFGLEEDWVFEIGLTPNRIDAASHVGVARDVVAVLNHQGKQNKYSVSMPAVASFKADHTGLMIPVVIEDQDACNRYCGVTISDVVVQESPGWLKNRLRAIGQKPINNVVDITNYVLHELGQPLHAFDVSSIEGRKVVVKKPEPGTKFLTLDKEELELTGDDLMICNAKEPMCMAGILGGLNAGVTMKTTHVFLESAWFSPVTIRKSSNFHGLKTDASFRFERGADPNMAPLALKRAAMMIKDIAGGSISSGMVDVYPVKKDRVQLTLHYHTVDSLIGKTIPRQEISGILSDLDFEIHQQSVHSLVLSVPAYRVDVTREADVVEEVLRIYGYNNIELPGKLHSSLVLSPKPDKEKLQNVISDMLVSRGFFEIMSNSLTKGTYYESDGFSAERSVYILNPLSQDLNVMRQSLLFGGLEAIVYNQNRRVSDAKLFEFGNVYWRSEDSDREASLLKGFGERMMLGLFLTGRSQPESWSVQETQVSFFDLKNAIDSIVKRLGISGRSFQLVHDENAGVFAYQQSMVYKGRETIIAGLLSNALTKRFDIRQQVFAAFIDWEHLIHLSGKQSLLYSEIGKFPEVRRDLALLVDVDTSFAAIEKLAFETERKKLKEVGLFDVYQDDKLGKSKKSYAVSFVLQDESKTLNDKEIDGVMDRLSLAFQEQLGASIR